jgi:hypothetical protein
MRTRARDPGTLLGRARKLTRRLGAAVAFLASLVSGQSQKVLRRMRTI